MTLADYLDQSETSRAAFARQIGVKWVSVDRYCNGRVPEAKVMERIIAATGGKVTANDFFALVSPLRAQRDSLAPNGEPRPILADSR